jgi:hypothetical protein
MVDESHGPSEPHLPSHDMFDIDDDGFDPISPTAARMVLGAKLRQLREQSTVSRGEAAYMLRNSGSKISRVELGRVGFKERDINDLLTMYGVFDPELRSKYVQLAMRANEPGWWHLFRKLMPDWFHDFVGLEESAIRIQNYEIMFVPGLLQTEDYARAIISHGFGEPGKEAADRRVALRMGRQKRVLYRPDPPKLWAIIDESVLYRPIGGLAVLKAQIGHLIDMCDRRNVTLQVVPFRMSGFAAETPFTILRFAEKDLPDLVYIEYLEKAVCLEKAPEVEPYGRALDRLAVDGETPEATRALLAKRHAEL